MKKFEFSLDKVLDFKNQMLDREKNELARMRVEKNRMEEQLAELVIRFDQVSFEMQEKSRKGTTAFKLKSDQFRLDNMRTEMKQISEEIDRQQQLIDIQLKTVVSISQDVSGLDKLKDKQKEEFARYEAKVQETEIAEFVAGKLVYSEQQ